MQTHNWRCSLRAVCFHPTDAYVATTDNAGRIILWHRFNEAHPHPHHAPDQNHPKAITSILHWHAHALDALTFSDDGAYMISGGEEAVLVLWQMQSGHKHFLPRIGSPIRTITIAKHSNLYALNCADNTIRYEIKLPIAITISISITAELWMLSQLECGLKFVV